VQTTINQRVKFLLEKFDLSARAFGKTIGVGENTTQNYLEPRLAQPRADYLEKILLHFASINADWLLTGRGEAFSSQVTEEHANYQLSKKNSGNVIGTNNGTATVNHLSDCEKDLLSANEKISLLNAQIELQAKLIRVYESQQPK
jgi:hypothetical protein